MYLEEQVKQLTEDIKELTEKVKYLESVTNEKWVSAKELAEIMGCSVNNVYIRIRSGEIYATKILGSPKIPLSQFYEPVKEEKKKEEDMSNKAIKDRVFRLC